MNNVTLTRDCAIAAAEKTLNITYFERVFASLDIHLSTRMLHIFICSLPGIIIFFKVVSQRAQFSEK